MKKIIFLTGTRADFGKIKSLIQILQNNKGFEVYTFVTGMHMQKEYGYTVIEVKKSGFKNIHTFQNQTHETTMDLTLAKTIEGFSEFVKNINPDLIVVHGDRVEALAGAIVGSLNNVLVAHIEGGEISGTIDELIRHSVSKLSHIHFVSNNEAAKRLIQMGELKEAVFEIGSPDIDVMFSNSLPTIEEVKLYYEINFNSYSIVMFHPVTTEYNNIETHVKNLVEALIISEKNYVVIYPNNDLGSTFIIKAFNQLKALPNFRVLPSLRFEYFLTMLKNANFIIGNSSAGVREASYYNVPAINVGSRQLNRVKSESVLNCSYDCSAIKNAIKMVENISYNSKNEYFGSGNSAQQFYKILNNSNIWRIGNQKQFKDI